MAAQHNRTERIPPLFKLAGKPLVNSSRITRTTSGRPVAREYPIHLFE